jgi:hypothetical protein
MCFRYGEHAGKEIDWKPRNLLRDENEVKMEKEN